VLAALGAADVFGHMLAVAASNGIKIDLLSTFSLTPVSRVGKPDASVACSAGTDSPQYVALYRPRFRAKDSSPILVYVEGGGWISGTRFDRSADMGWFSDQGWLVVSVDYVLSSEKRHRWNQTTGEIGCALAWVGSNAHQYDGDTRRISLFGESAGGNL